MVGLLHAMAFMMLLLVGWVMWNNKPLPFGRHKTKNNRCTMFSIAGCSALQHSAHIFSAKPAYNALR